MFDGQSIIVCTIGSTFKAKLICTGEGGCKHNPLVQILVEPLPKELPGCHHRLHKGNDICKKVKSASWPQRDLYYIYKRNLTIEFPELDNILGL